jgi:hypothetical protein
LELTSSLPPGPCNKCIGITGGYVEKP